MGDFGGDTPSERELRPSMLAKLANLSAMRGRCAREIRGQYPLATPMTYAVAPIRTPASKPIVSNFSLILTHYGRWRNSY